MFYLKYYLKCLVAKKVIFTLQLFCGVFLIFISSQRGYFHTIFEKWGDSFKNYKSFNVLIENEGNVERIQRKVEQLPGVSKVEVMSSEKIKKGLNKVVKDLKVDLPQVMLSGTFSGLKVYLLQDIDKRSVDLIKEYINRLVGAENVTISPISERGKTTFEKINSILLQFKSYSWMSLLVIMILFYQLLGYSINKKIGNTAFLIESFQRRKFVGIKINLMGGALVLLLGLLFTSIVNPTSMQDMLMATTIFSCSVILTSLGLIGVGKGHELA